MSIDWKDLKPVRKGKFIIYFSSGRDYSGDLLTRWTVTLKGRNVAEGETDGGKDSALFEADNAIETVYCNRQRGFQ